MEEGARARRRDRGHRRVPVTIAVLNPADRSPNSDTCPFFRSIDASGAIRTPFEVPHDANRCVAVAQPTPQAIRQQQLVCLTATHLNCPRYLRGALVARQAPQRILPRPVASPPILLATAVLVLAAVASVGFLFARGGMVLALPSSTPGGAAAASASAPPSLEPTPAAPSPTPLATPAASATPSPPPAATATPTAAPPSPTPPPVATPRPTSDRYAVLVPCPDAADCWIYTVRPGDNFQSIVNWFGVPFDTVVEMNPGLGDVANIHVGDRIRIPPPTR